MYLEGGDRNGYGYTKAPKYQSKLVTTIMGLF
jgi:hypothetical protein